MYPPRWGPTFWTFLHTMVYCHRDRATGLSVWSPGIWDMIRATIDTIPCPQCLVEATKYLVEHGPTHTVTSPVEWIRVFHNSVNRRLGKPEYCPEMSERLVRKMVHQQSMGHQRQPTRRDLSRVRSSRQNGGAWTRAIVGGALIAIIALVFIRRYNQSPRHDTRRSHVAHYSEIADPQHPRNNVASPGS